MDTWLKIYSRDKSREVKIMGLLQIAVKMVIPALARLLGRKIRVMKNGNGKVQRCWVNSSNGFFLFPLSVRGLWVL